MGWVKQLVLKMQWWAVAAGLGDAVEVWLFLTCRELELSLY